MGRLGNFFTTAGKSATNLGPLDALFAGFDYAGGKAEGEDDIRAAAGAGGSALGGWGGAVGGAAIGTAILPGIGTGIGALVGGGLGGFGGGWGADRIDQAVRGNRGANTLERLQENNTSRNVLAGTGAIGAAGYGLNKLFLGKNMYRTDPRVAYETARLAGLGRGQAAAAASTVAPGYAGDVAGAAYKAIPGWGKVAGAVGAGVVANNMAGNPVGGAIDALSGGRTDFRPNTSTNELMENRMEADRYSNDMYNRQIQRQRDQTGFGSQREYMDYLNQQGIANQERQYNRKFEYDDYMNRMDIGAKQAAALLGSDEAMSRAGRDAQTILSARYF